VLAGFVGIVLVAEPTHHLACGILLITRFDTRRANGSYANST
jgi:hypothetical protein